MDMEESKSTYSEVMKKYAEGSVEETLDIVKRYFRWSSIVGKFEDKKIIAIIDRKTKKKKNKTGKHICMKLFVTTIQ